MSNSKVLSTVTDKNNLKTLIDASWREFGENPKFRKAQIEQFAIAAMRSNPDIANCSSASLVNALITLTQLPDISLNGYQPDAHLVVFAGKKGSAVVLMTDYTYERRQIKRTDPDVNDVRTEYVIKAELDKFNYSPTPPYSITHGISITERSKFPDEKALANAIEYVYCLVQYRECDRYPNGAIIYSVMNKAEINTNKSYAKANTDTNTPWNKSPVRMMLKSVVRRFVKDHDIMSEAMIQQWSREDEALSSIASQSSKVQKLEDAAAETAQESIIPDDAIDANFEPIDDAKEEPQQPEVSPTNVEPEGDYNKSDYETFIAKQKEILVIQKKMPKTFVNTKIAVIETETLGMSITEYFEGNASIPLDLITVIKDKISELS